MMVVIARVRDPRKGKILSGWMKSTLQGLKYHRLLEPTKEGEEVEIQRRNTMMK
ncbi:hypothetical protein [Methanothermobacter tenebrarum]|uniref:hypothetical protein n=1 Tax=Methanothermobacter tenebrarum TaxID=680118 RepID=UPI0015EB5938|nr:hypothetical protein [Methanothermobacter tenebrarum]NPV64063.1 hypothetical protein [Methanobacteriaceae archaeon]